MVRRLVDVDPRPDRARLLADLRVPPTFATSTLANYLPDPAEPTQAAALARIEAFTAAVATAPADASRTSATPRRGRFGRRRATPPPAPAVYLDGGFGVGKTHLLAAAATAVRTAGHPVVFGTFVELTHLVGALGFAGARDALSRVRLLCIDEFELDDPGDTVLMSTLLGHLAGAGVALAATSNTLPGALGEDRFAADDFRREIQGLAARFDVVHLDGPDHRHRDRLPAAPPLAPDRLQAWADAHGPGATLDDAGRLLDHLRAVHPSRYGALLDGVSAVAVADLTPVSDQNAALRLVVLVDRLYDRGLPVAVSGVPAGELFTPELLAGGYRKKYGRALSRLAALTAATTPD